MSFDEDFQRITAGFEPETLAAAVRGTNGLVVRAGVPQIYGALVEAAAAARIPVLFSANAFAITDKETKEFSGFRLSALKKMPAHLDAALDSAGFVAMARYGDYRWTAEEYMQLVSSRDWTWWAAQDYCVEPPVASASVTKEMRLHATVQGYHRGVRLAQKWGVKNPMPVIQGWTPEDYVKCVEMFALRDDEWPDLVGIGSVCRRNLFGPNGLATVIEALDAILPARVRYHLFGVKGGAVQRLGAHPRFASIDSQAYDYGVRAVQRTGRTQQMRVDAMLGWQADQSTIVPDLYAPVPQQEQLTFGGDEPATAEAVVHQAVADWYADELLPEHGYRDAAWRALEQAELITLKLAHFGHECLADSSDMADMAAYDALADAGYVPAREDGGHLPMRVRV
ncbi:deazapurine DNA modification protein DpdA family protein [Ramlibacter sp. AN1133]|uniref:deazapurine DNA modification protein DpdA family protein n=1 Tax=Ramlibacter sp. AN1133 TaxID=3133429 RepID=UPI0030BD8B10